MDNPFIISPRITFEVTVRLLGGLMALGYSIAAIHKRSSHVFTSERVVVKIDWLEQLNRHYIQSNWVWKDLIFHELVLSRFNLKNLSMKLQRSKMTKLSIDDEVVSSPTEALSGVSADIAMRNTNLKRSSFTCIISLSV